ncbi:MAG TPA: hypothetical protein VLT91_06230 [Rhizomicrobium sp.]|nr:hypothetical protein [Rhizomicrobium sp.]
MRGGTTQESVLRILRLPIASPFVELPVIVLLVPLLLGVAIWNGFPLIFYDTGAYILQGLGRHFVVERSPVYSLFLSYGGGGTSLWRIAIIQAFLSAFVIVETARCVAPKMGVAAFAAVALALVVFTGLPWYAGQIEPDCFTALTVLCTYLLAFHARDLGTPRAVAIFLTAAFAAATHPSHILLIVGLVMIVAVFKIISIARNGAAGLRLSSLALPLTSAVLAVVMTFAANFVLTGKLFFNRAGSVFVFASMLQDGLVARLLDDTCPQSGYRLCAYKSDLPDTAERWLWFPDSPFTRLGHFAGTAAESQRIVNDILVRYPGGFLLSTINDTAEQLVDFRTGDQIEPQEWAIHSNLVRYIPHQMTSYMRARQQEGKIHFHYVNDVHWPVAALGQIGAMAALVMMVRRRRWNSAIFIGFTLAALLGNAVICGALSNPHDRYQSRLVWLPVFALALLGTEGRFSLRDYAESVT